MYVVADVLKWADEYQGEPYHALLCDAPYHLTTITKRFKKPSKRDKAIVGDNPYSRTSRGFMGQEWDGGDLAFKPDTWDKLARHLHPGAFVMAFASARGYHRMAVAMEDSGLILHPSIFGWLYSSGFPKATRVNVDGFEGHRYGLQAIKPALEPVIVAQKPYQGKPRECIQRTGAGTLNIDAGRVPAEPYRVNAWKDGAHPFGGGAGGQYQGRQETAGRWPANFFVDESAAIQLDKQGYSESPTQTRLSALNTPPGSGGTMGKGWAEPRVIQGYGDKGGASRFFYNVQDKLESSDPVYLCSKAATSEREQGLIGKLPCGYCGGLHSESHVKDGKEQSCRRNIHPTVKPIGLAKYLAGILLPPAIYSPRRLLVPFAGVGSEMIGARLAGWEHVTGVELTAEYEPIARERVNYWAAAVQMELGLFA